MGNTVTIELKKPIKAHGEELCELTLREPIAKDYADCGYPVSFSDGGSMVVEAGNIAKLLAALSSVPPTSIGQMSASDFNSGVGIVMGFLAEDQATA